MKTLRLGCARHFHEDLGNCSAPSAPGRRVGCIFRLRRTGEYEVKVWVTQPSDLHDKHALIAALMERI